MYAGLLHAECSFFFVYKSAALVCCDLASCFLCSACALRLVVGAMHVFLVALSLAQRLLVSDLFLLASVALCFRFPDFSPPPPPTTIPSSCLELPLHAHL